MSPVFYFLCVVIGVLVSIGVMRLARWKHGRAVRKRWRGVAVLVPLLLLMAGCASNDPNAVLNAVDDAADIAQVSVILFTDPGPNQTKLLAEIEKARSAADLPALRRIISHFNGTPATRPTV